MTSNDMLIEPLTSRETDILRLIAAGLSNREISLQLFLSEGTIKWHNKHIFSKLDVRSRTEAIVRTQALRLLHPPPSLTADKPRYNLPSQPTTFIGRESELQQIVERIRQSDCRLLTLMGSGGVGKTSLAVQAAEQLLPDFQDGVFFVPLEAISSPDQVIAALAQACHLTFYEGVDMRQQLFDFLQSKKLLLVIDNFEHLLEAKADVCALLEQASHLKILITTRVPLHVPEEWVLVIGGMSFPKQVLLDDTDEFDAVRLFLACARRSGKTISVDDLAHVAAICRWTQGMPLAIKLAASWLRTLTCQAIAQELRAGTDLLTTPLNDLPERHQSMRRVFQQSWNLLAEDDRKTLQALSIFRGGFTSASVKAVTGASLTELARLIDYSLVQVTGDGRYDLHPLISQYLHEHLLASGELALVSAAHAGYYAEFLHIRLNDLMGGRQLAALNEIQAEFENVSAAWLWLIEQQDYGNLEKAWEPLLIYICVRGGEAVFRHVRRLPLSVEHPLLPYLYYCLPDLAEEEIRRTLAIAQQYQDSRAQAFTLYKLAGIFGTRLEYAMAVSCLAECLALFRQLGEDYYVAGVLLEIAYHVLGSSEKAKLAELYEESLRLNRSLNDRLGIAGCLHEMASRMFFDGDYARAEPYVREALSINQEFANRHGMLFCTQFLGHLHLLPGNYEVASQLYQTALAIAEDMGGIWRQAFSFTLGFLANTRGHYLEADAQFNQSRAVFSHHPFAMMFADWGQSVAHCGLGRYEAAQEYVCAALKFALKMDSVGCLTLCLPSAALILWNDGRQDLAVEMMALALSHPKSQQAWFLNSPLGENIVERMKSDLGLSEFEQAWQRGIKRDLHENSLALLTLYADSTD